MGTFYSFNDYRLYIEHHGIKGMKWGVRRYRNEDGSLTSAGRKREAKRQYKSNKEALRAETKRLYQVHSKESNPFGGTIQREYKRSKAELKEKYKAGQISRSQFKAGKKQLNANRRSAFDSSEKKCVIGQFYVRKLERENDAAYLSEIKGRDSKAFRKAYAKAQSATESIGNYRVTALPDGTFHITRYDVYYY